MICKEALKKALEIDKRRKEEIPIKNEEYEESEFMGEYNICPRCVGNLYIKSNQYNIITFKCKMCKIERRYVAI